MWNVSNAVRSAESQLQYTKVAGYHQIGKAGFGLIKQKDIPTKGCQKYRKTISDIVYEHEEEIFQARAVQLHIQGNWMKWCSYVKNDLSWSTLLALPQCLISFCIGSTYDTLPSPSNLVRWGLQKDASCSLCKKNICTVPHILGACKVALTQGRFTYRHDTVLRTLVTSLQDFLSSYKPSLSNKPRNIRFVSAGTYSTAKKKKPPPIGILHSASDWTVMCDLDTTLIIPPDVAVTQLRPDIVLLSRMTKAVIVIELTCPCEENMEKWHDTKTDKYSLLLRTIQINGWAVHFFAVEVGARGYCSDSVRTCLRRLGFPPKSIRCILKLLGSIAMKCSFHIWLARDSKPWETLTTTTDSFPESKSPFKFAKSKSPVDITDMKMTSSGSTKELMLTNSGIQNKGNTCYANSILQCLNSLPQFHVALSAGNPSLSPLASACSKVFYQLSSSKVPVDPSAFLAALKNAISKVKGNFDIFTQHDVPEILGYLLSELATDSLFTTTMFQFCTRTTITCDTCFQSHSTDEMSLFLELQPRPTIQESLNLFLQPEVLTGNDKWFCPLCNSHQTATRETEIVNSGSHLIVQLKRFIMSNGHISKQVSPVSCFPDFLSLPVTIDPEVRSRKHFKIRALINHSGSLNNGHYTAIVQDQKTDQWLHCNDRAVTKCDVRKELNSKLSYVFLFQAV